MSIESTPPMSLFSAIQDAREAEREYNEACVSFEQKHVEAAEARVLKEAHYENLIRAREVLVEVATSEPGKPVSDVASVRVVPSYLDTRDRLLEGVDAAWSEKGPDAKDEVTDEAADD